MMLRSLRFRYLRKKLLWRRIFSLLVVLCLLSSVHILTLLFSDYQAKSDLFGFFSLPQTPEYEQDLRKVKLNFSMIPTLTKKDCSDACMTGKVVNWNIAILIQSAAKNAKTREDIRKTWASLRYLDGAKLTTFFLLGKGEDEKSELLREEQTRHGDLVQYNASEGVTSVPLKSLAALQWASEHLPDNFFLLTTSDDALLNLGTLPEDLVLITRRIVTSKWPYFVLVCSFGQKQTNWVSRNASNRYFSKAIYFRWPKYPPNCDGDLYFASVEVVKQLYERSRFVRNIPNGQVWVTGLLRKSTGMPDEMLIEFSKGMVTHLHGFKSHNHSRLFLYDEWRRIKDELVKKQSCFC